MEYPVYRFNRYAENKNRSGRVEETKVKSNQDGGIYFFLADTTVYNLLLEFLLLLPLKVSLFFIWIYNEYALNPVCRPTEWDIFIKLSFIFIYFNFFFAELILLSSVSLSFFE